MTVKAKISHPEISILHNNSHMPNTLNVAVAVIINDKNEVCISLRHKDSHQGDLWEFPGGKVESGETIEQALTREIKEELGLDITQSKAFINITHEYDDKSVCLHVYKVVSYQGQATGLEGQQVKWLPVDQLRLYEFPQANQAIINTLILPDKYLVTGKFSDQVDFENKLSSAIKKGVRLVQLRLKQDGVENLQLADQIIRSAARLCEQANVLLMLNVPTVILKRVDLSAITFAGFHLDSRALNNHANDNQTELQPGSYSRELQGLMLSASCHNASELNMAIQVAADFVVLSPVQKTASHPEMAAMGWQKFSQLLEGVPFPVYALGGVAEKDLSTATDCGAQGIAAISALWE